MIAVPAGVEEISMRIFDDVSVSPDVSLPGFDGDPSTVGWQTKTFVPARDRYELTASGRLLTDRYRVDDDGWTDTGFHGSFEFYAHLGSQWFEYEATFVDGDLESIDRIHRRERAASRTVDAGVEVPEDDPSGPDAEGDPWAVEYAAEAMKDTVTDELGLSIEEFEAKVVENVDAGKPWLVPPLEAVEIDSIEDERLRALAWHLDALARAYNYASDPTLPDLLAEREEDRTELEPAELATLNEACDRLLAVYDRLYERVWPELEEYRVADG